jgi:hypothetical protein
MTMAWLIFGLIDLIVTILISVSLSWFFITRHLARRGPDRLGRKDVVLLRECYSILLALLTIDDMSALGLPDNIRVRAQKAVDTYASTSEDPT